MDNRLCFTIRFNQPYFHGRGDQGEPEWPPSPLRLFQALIAASAARWNERESLQHSVEALRWLENQPWPELIAPEASQVTPFRTAVPNNDLDVWAASLAKGREPKKQPSELKTMKTISPSRLSGETVHFLYALPAEGCPHLEVLQDAAKSITHLGWGIDTVVGHVEVLNEKAAALLEGHRWRVVPGARTHLRAPKAGTLEELIHRHQRFLNRLSDGGFRPVPPLGCFDTVPYHCLSRHSNESMAPLMVFEIHRTMEEQDTNPRSSRFRAFHHVRRVASLAGMVRHAAAEVGIKLGHQQHWVNEHILGHDSQTGAAIRIAERFKFLPLPSITPNGVNGIRRVMIAGWPGLDISRFRRLLNGHELIEEASGNPIAMLSHLATSDVNVRRFTESSRVWSTVTPVFLPGFDDPDGGRSKAKHKASTRVSERKELLSKIDKRVRGLIRKAFIQAGWAEQLMEATEVEYRKVGWHRGLELASNYRLPPLNYPKYHLRVQFPQAVSGPIAIGPGRFRGMGLFVRED